MTLTDTQYDYGDFGGLFWETSVAEQEIRAERLYMALGIGWDTEESALDALDFPTA